MKVLEFIESLIVPKKMFKRKDMNVFITIIILLLITFLISLPLTIYLSKDRYNTFDNQLDFNYFNYVSDDITDEEKLDYNMITFNEFKELNAKIDRTGVYEKGNVTDDMEYVLKSILPVLDEEGTITNYITKYIHIVFDLDDDNHYDYSESFDKLRKDEDGNFNHFLVIFYESHFAVRTGADIDASADLVSTKYYGDAIIILANLENMTELSHSLIDMLYPKYSYNYKLRALLYVFLFPTVISLIFSLVLRDSGTLRGFKEYFNYMVISAIPFCLLCLIFSFIRVGFANAIFNLYSIMFSIYYFVLLVIYNRRPKTE